MTTTRVAAGDQAAVNEATRARRSFIHHIYELFFRFTRKRRMRRFEMFLEPKDDDRVLDVGGTPFNWQYLTTRPKVILLNVAFSDGPPDDTDQFEFIIGDARAMEYADRGFPIAYSNSVIEHVGNFEDQKRFANEVRRVGNGVWVQTPARCFPLEPHYLTPFIHWLPKSWRRRLGRNFTVWGWLERPVQEAVDERVEEIRLLSRREMKELFPDCEILVERFFLLPRCYIAMRRRI
ncbi:MAG: class I SAM-dependent methyltransferase [Pirellulales bacterium]